MILDRDFELGRLHHVLGDVESTGGCVVFVRGEAGIGKSALVAQFVAEVGDQAHVLVGGCDDLLTPQPLGPIWDAARHDPSILAPLSRGDRRAVMEVLFELLSRKLRPTVLVIEDVQWADEATLDLIKYLGRRIGMSHGLLILTYRDGEVDAAHPLRRVIGELPPQNIVRIHLGRLSAEAVAAMLGDTGLDVDEVLALTGGNPMFVTEVLKSGTEEVPASVRDSVLARAAKVSPEGRRIIDLVSVFPQGAERALIDDILDPTPEQLTECERQGLLRVHEETLVFHHELARRAVESALSAADHRQLNRLVLTRIAGHADPAVVVHHARSAADSEAIVQYAPMAARAAVTVGSHREALSHFRTLGPYLDRVAETERAAILDDWARIEYYLDETAALDILSRAIDLHRSSGADRALARALTFAARLNEVSGRPEVAEACSAEAVAILESHPPSGDLAFAVSQRAWLFLMRGAGDRAVGLADRAIGIAERVGDELAIIHSLNTKGCELCRCGDSTGFEVLEECRGRAEQHGYYSEEVRALGNMADLAGRFFLELEWAIDLAQRARDTAARHQLGNDEAHARVLLAEILVMRGDWAAAQDSASELLDSSAGINAIATRLLGTLQARSGRPEASLTLERAWSLALASAEPQHLAPTAAALAEFMWLTEAEDRDQVGACQDLLEAASPYGARASTGSLAFWLWKLGRLSTIPDRIAEPYRLVLHGQPTDAAAIWKAKGAPYEQALALMHGGEAEQRHALDIFEGLGASATADRVRRMLHQQGVRVPRGTARTTLTHVAGLTPRQAEVLELLAEGLTSPQIADRLFIARRTAENHVAAILMKLDVTSRVAAVDAARARGLLT